MANEPQSFQQRVAAIIGSPPLAAALYRSLRAALNSRFVCLVNGATPWDIFDRSLKAAIRDIEDHPRGKLFRRLLLYGPEDADQRESLTTGGETRLSDLECGLCVEFIFSHMINRFKGELAELLAIEPVLDITRRLIADGCLPPRVRLYWGETIQEPRRVRPNPKNNGVQRLTFAKGADGLLVKEVGKRSSDGHGHLVVYGVVEVKSMVCPLRRVSGQVDRHVARLRAGVRLKGKEWSARQLTVGRDDRHGPSIARPIRIAVIRAWQLPSFSWIHRPADSKPGETGQAKDLENQPRLVRRSSCRSCLRNDLMVYVPSWLTCLYQPNLAQDMAIHDPGGGGTQFYKTSPLLHPNQVSNRPRVSTRYSAL